jgi:putative ABC transport system ATP-binding protein
MMSATWLETTQLCRYYRRGPHEVRAVDKVDLSIPRGEFVRIVGASGSGKSTLLNLLAGLDTPTHGHIKIDNVPLNSLTRRQLSAYRAKQVGMVFQSFNLLPYKTALENVEMALFFNSVPYRERRTRSIDILETLGLGDRIDHRPSDLSGGEQQRVAIARALVKRPEVIFADEPTGNLDHDNSIQIAGLLANLNQDGLTVILVTHDLDLAKQYAPRTIRMQYGTIVNDSGRKESQ